MRRFSANRIKLMGNIRLSTAEGKTETHQTIPQDARESLALTNTETQKGQGKHPTVEVFFPALMVSAETLKPTPDKKVDVTICHPLSFSIRGKCVASNHLRSLVIFDDKALKDLERSIVIRHKGGIQVLIPTAHIASIQADVKMAPFPKAAIVQNCRMQVIKRAGKELTERETILARATQHPVARRRSRHILYIIPQM